MKLTSRSSKCSVPVALVWSHGNDTYRITAWPEVRCERRYGNDWAVVNAPAEAIVAAASALTAAEWQSYLEFAPMEVREFAGFFRQHRLAAVQVAARCPELIEVLTTTPALTPFVAAHGSLRGTGADRWEELRAVAERGGIFAILEWLGLPASHQTLAILGNVVAADLPARLLGPLREVLWRPDGIFALAQLPVITDRELTRACNALAA
jgi:hypothetical protein